VSWSVSAAGTPAEVADKLEAYGAQLTGQSKLEFDEARPHLAALVGQNFHDATGEARPPRVQLTAHGSGYAAGDRQVSRSCAVQIGPAPG
jgi:hypothetical protein